MNEYIIGLDYGSASARGVLLDIATGQEVASHVHDYRHGTLTNSLPDGTPLPRSWALQVADDYLEAAREILCRIGNGKRVRSIGLGFTASSPLPCRADGTPLHRIAPDAPHAYVKLWKHGAAQPQAERISARGGAWLDNFNGKVSGEWLMAKAAQIAEEAPEIWAQTDKFIEGGDWLVWQLTGTEARGLGFAAYKAQFQDGHGYPDVGIPGMASRLTDPLPVGSPAGDLTDEWLADTGIVGPCSVAVAVIDSHVVLPAVGAVKAGTFVAALGTSAGVMMIDDQPPRLPKGIEGVAFNGALRDLWCYEAGQASFGDTLAWFVEAFPNGSTPAESFANYEAEARQIPAGANRLLALDWWNGNRVPHARSDLSGMILGLNMQTTSVDVYRALIEALCYGMRLMHDLFAQGGFDIGKVIMTSGLASRNALLIQTMADVLGREIIVPEIANATAVGAAIHGAVASEIVSDYADGATRFGARSNRTVTPDMAAHATYEQLFQNYRALVADPVLQDTMRKLREI